MTDSKTMMENAKRIAALPDNDHLKFTRTADEKLSFATRPDFLRAAGEALYGDRWQTAIARDLEVSDRTVRNWSADKFEVPIGVMRDVLALLHVRKEEIEKVHAAGRVMPDGSEGNDWYPDMPEGGDDGYG